MRLRLGLLRMIVAVCAWLVCACGAEPIPNLVLISLDTVRQDHLPSHGYARDTAPNLSAFAARAVVFDNAFAQDTNTVPSHASMFTGLYPHRHGSFSNKDPLPPHHVTLSQLLEREGFRTAAFVSGLAMLKKASALERGFEIYSDEFESYKRDGEVTTDLALRWLDSIEPDQRFFLFLHLYDAHGPYQTERPYARRFTSAEPGSALTLIPKYQQLYAADGKPVVHLNEYVDRYDTMIHYVDAQVARLLQVVDPNNTVVVVTADHGETLGERYWTLDHGGALWDEQLRIPLLIQGPGFEPRRVEPLVETVDFLPTLLELLDVEAPEKPKLDGWSLVPWLRGRAPEWRERTFASARTVHERHVDRGYMLTLIRRTRSIRSLQWKLIRYPGPYQDYTELYDVVADPGETRNLEKSQPELGKALLAELDGWSKGTELGTMSPNLPPELREKLKNLGYIDE